MNPASPYVAARLIEQARQLAAEYRRSMGKPLPGVSAEIGVHDAVNLLDLHPVASGLGHDALGTGPRAGRRVLIKSRAIFDEGRPGQRLGQLKTDGDWDLLVVVLMDEDYRPSAIYEADREDIDAALAQNQGSRRRNRGALSVARLKIVGRLAWTPEEGAIDDEIRGHQGD